MGVYMNENGYVCYVRDGYNMQTGTENPYHRQHIREFQQMANEIAERKVRELAPKICAEMFNDAIMNLIPALEQDVTTALDVSINDMGEIFAGEKTTKFVSQQIAKQLQARLSNFKIKF